MFRVYRKIGTKLQIILTESLHKTRKKNKSIDLGAIFQRKRIVMACHNGKLKRIGIRGNGQKLPLSLTKRALQTKEWYNRYKIAIIE